MFASSQLDPITTPPRTKLSGWISLLEIFAAWGLIEMTIWTSGKTQLRLFWISAVFIIASTVAHRPRPAEMGLGRRGLRSSLWVVPAALVLASAAILLAWEAGTLHPLFGSSRIAAHSSGYFVWAIFQQFILQSYFFLRLEKLISTRWAVVLSAALFCLVHIPNPVLVVVCLFAGWFACEVFRRNRNIYALGVAHAILGLTIAVTVPDHIQRHMRVGIGYYHYHQAKKAFQEKRFSRSVSVEAFQDKAFQKNRSVSPSFRTPMVSPVLKRVFLKRFC